jgi:hypothetical protein
VLGSLGLAEDDLDDLTERTMGDFFLTRSSEPWSADEVRACFAEALAIDRR